MAAATEIRIWMKNDVIVRFRPIRSRLLAIRSTFQDGVNSTSYGRDEHLFLEKKMTVLGLSSNVKGNGSDFGCADWLRTQSDFSLAVCLFVCLFVFFQIFGQRRGTSAAGVGLLFSLASCGRSRPRSMMSARWRMRNEATSRSMSFETRRPPATSRWCGFAFFWFSL